MNKSIAVIILTALVSCTNGYSVQSLDEVDKIQIHSKTKGLIYTGNDSVTIDILKEIVDGKQELHRNKSKAMPCEVEGSIWFMKGDMVVEMAAFSSSSIDCLVLLISHGEGGPYSSFKLTGRASAFLNNVMIKKSSNVGDNQH